MPSSRASCSRGRSSPWIDSSGPRTSNLRVSPLRFISLLQQQEALVEDTLGPGPVEGAGGVVEGLPRELEPALPLRRVDGDRHRPPTTLERPLAGDLVPLMVPESAPAATPGRGRTSSLTVEEPRLVRGAGRKKPCTRSGPPGRHHGPSGGGGRRAGTSTGCRGARGTRGEARRRSWPRRGRRTNAWSGRWRPPCRKRITVGLLDRNRGERERTERSSEGSSTGPRRSPLPLPAGPTR